MAGSAIDLVPGEDRLFQKPDWPPNWDRDGLAIWYKRLEEGTFRIPRPIDNATTPHVELKASELAMLLEGIDLRSIRRSRRYTRPGLHDAALIRPPDEAGGG